MSTNSLCLFCLVDGKPALRAFPVSAPATTTTGELKGLIMTTLARWFDGIPAKDLTPWRVTIADCGDIAPISIHDVPDNEKKKLRTTDRVSIFGVALPAGTIHVIVQQLLPTTTLKRLLE